MLKQILTAALLTVAAGAQSADLPKRKSGLWEVTMTSSARAASGKGATAMSLCVDQNTDADWLQQTQQSASQKCSRQDVKVERNRVQFDSVCSFGKTTATTHGVASGDFNKEYKVETNSTYDPPLAGRKESSNTLVARWIGPCKAGQKPGDVIMPNGMTMNMNDMRRGAPK